MITTNDIIKMARRVAQRGDGIPDRKLMHPYREWYIGLGLFFLVVAIGAAYNAFTFRHYSTIENRVRGSGAEIVRYRNEIADRVLEAYRARIAEFSNLQIDIPAAAPAAVTPADQSADTAPQDGVRLE